MWRRDEAIKPCRINRRFGLSGALSRDASSGLVTLAGRALKYAEPAEARAPDKHWRLHVFKGAAEVGEPLRLHRQSAFLVGRDRSVADIALDHPSCSKQHAVIQFRLVALPQPPGSVAPPRRAVLPYLLDLESTNFSYLNGERVLPARYTELRAKDVLRFGESSREFVLLFDELVPG